MLAIWRFEAAFFVVTDGVTEVVHHHPREKAGFGVLGDEVIFGTGAPENASVDAEHGDDAVVFFSGSLPSAKTADLAGMKPSGINFWTLEGSGIS